MISAHSSLGRVTVTERAINIHHAGSDRSINRDAITEVRINLGTWYVFGFLRTLTLVVEDERPIRLRHMRKSKAYAIKQALGF